MRQQNEDKEVMELAIGAGHLLLENGAEIFRVEETMDRICRFSPRFSISLSAERIWTRWRR